MSSAVIVNAGTPQGMSTEMFEKRMAVGDLSVIQSIGSMPLQDLYGVLLLALRRQFGDQSSQVKGAAIEAIKQFPYHGRFLGDEIDRLSNEQGTLRERQNDFYLLTNIGSPEAIRQIGRFLLDERNPEKDIPEAYFIGAASNSYWAADAMGSVLGNKPGIKNKPGFYNRDDVVAWQSWWQSPAAAQYRNPIVEQPHPAPPVQLEPKKRAPSKSNESTAESHALSAQNSEKLLFISLLIVICGGVVFLIWRRRMKQPGER